MGNLIETGQLSEMTSGKNFSYVLSNPSLFSNMDYKVLQSNGNGSFIKCMKMLYNGKIQLYYVTAKYRSFSNMIPQLDADSFVSTVANIFESVNEVRSNGFLKCENVDISFDHIFIDPATHKAYLIYVPLSECLYSDEEYFENELRSSFTKMILSSPTLSTPKTMGLLSNLQDAAMPLEDVFENTVYVGTVSNLELPPEIPAKKPTEVRFIPLNGVEQTTLYMDKNEYVIGRSNKHADGVIQENKMVGRTHCKISFTLDGVDVEDLNSANGTYVNRVKIPSGGHTTLYNGDILRLANLEFKVLIK